jgi:prevent-host-death family protein
MTSREFNRDTAAAERAAEDGPVLITDRGQSAHVLVSYRHYQRLIHDGRSVVDLLRSPRC